MTIHTGGLRTGTFPDVMAPEYHVEHSLPFARFAFIAFILAAAALYARSMPCSG